MIHCDRKLFNPNGFWLWRYALDTSVRYVVLYGGSSSGKSFSAAQVLSIISFAERTNTLVMRKVGNTIEKSIYTDFKTAIKGVKGLADHCRFKINSIVFDNGAKIDFTGIDDPEKIKGISQYKRVLLDELSEFDESDFKQIRLRLRGMEGQQIVATFNPVSEGHWIKKRWFDREEWHAVPLRLSFAGEDLPEALCRVRGVRMNAEKTIINPSTGEYERHAPDTVVVHSTYLDNFWVVGSPDGRYGYYDHQAIANYEYNRVHDPDYYHIYALGEWGHIRTGAEFFPSFSPSAVCGAFPFKEGLPVHVSMDSNVLPYVTATFFQKEYRGDVEEVTQFAELPVESPDNSARKAARKIAAFLADMGYRDTLYLHGDASGRAANTIDPDNRSFFDLVIDELEKEGFAVEDCVAAKNPSVALSGEFINAVWDGRVENVSIRVDEGCAVSIGDYQAVQKDENGAILKQRVRDPVTKQSYEPWGHCFVGDTMVATDHGDVPIKDVKIGDRVLTRFGYSNVYNSLCTSRNTRYFFVTLCGETLRCTYDHPIYTDRGFVPAYQLRVGDTIVKLIDGKLCRERLQRTTVASSIATLMQNVRAIGDTLRVGLRLTGRRQKSHSTATCGSLSVVQFPKAIMFITLMAITAITQSTTWLCCWLMTMSRSITRMFLKRLKKCGNKHCGTIETKQPNGTTPKKGASGILKTLKNKWRNVSSRLTLANVVVRSSEAVLSRVASSAGIIASQNGAETKALTTWSVFVQSVALNLLSIATQSRSIAASRVPLSIAGRCEVYDISVDDAEFFADGILVHNCSDTLRYACIDLLRRHFTDFSMGRKRSLYAEGEFGYFNPSANYEYERTLSYILPSFGGLFVLARVGKAGDDWHLTDAMLREVRGNDEMAEAIAKLPSDRYVVECPPAWFPFVRSLRGALSGVDVMRMGGDHRLRIAAMSDWVRAHVLIRPDATGEYGRFIADALDYTPSSPMVSGASAALSGIARVIARGGVG